MPAPARLRHMRPNSRRSRRAAIGRLPEVTNGFFVEANHEKPALSVGQLWSDPKGGSGSGAGTRSAPLKVSLRSKPPLARCGQDPKQGLLTGRRC